MLTREDVAQLLTLQAKAYELLMWLGAEGVKDPDLLSPAVVALLGEPLPAAAWLDQHRKRIPPALLPPRIEGPFANLLSSFFSTSFNVTHLDFGDRLVDSRLRLGMDRGLASHVGLDQSQALALKHLAASEGISITEKTARGIVKRATVRPAALLWTYVWELDRRSKKKGKGPVVHKIWRSIPWETKKALSVDRVWEARAQLVAASREAGDS
jgi:DNA-binding transcriptional regulator YdaS (Cro superfamily)